MAKVLNSIYSKEQKLTLQNLLLSSSHILEGICYLRLLIENIVLEKKMHPHYLEWIGVFLA